MNNAAFETVNYRVENGVALIELNRPQCLNAMNYQLVADTGDAFALANRDNEVRSVLFSGAGRAFCAGDDRNEHRHPETESEARKFVDAIQRVTREMVLGEKPVVGAIHGWAVGGGFEWAINCDFPIWERNAKAFFPEVSLNLFVTGGVTALLPALVGLNRSREMLMLGEKYDATELMDFGVAWRVAENDRLMHEAQKIAEKLAAQPPLSLRAMKRVLSKTSAVDLERALALETDATVAGFMDPETTRLLSDF